MNLTISTIINSLTKEQSRGYSNVRKKSEEYGSIYLRKLLMSDITTTQKNETKYFKSTDVLRYYESRSKSHLIFFNGLCVITWTLMIPAKSSQVVHEVKSNVGTVKWRHNVYSGKDKKNQSSTSLAFVRGIHRWPVNSPHKGPVTPKSFHLMTSSCHTKDTIYCQVRRLIVRFLKTAV